MIFRRSILILLCFFTVCLTQAQQRFGMGEVLDLDLIARTPQKIAVSERSFRDMPSQYSLEKYAPVAGDQGPYGTCTAWAVGYGIATILYAKTHGLTDKELINRYAFSPTFLYEHIKDSDDHDCQDGASTVKALNTLIKVGDATLSTVPYKCGVVPTERAKSEAANYKISDAAILFTQRGISKDDAYAKKSQEMIELTKKAIMEGSPVAIAFMLPESFFSIKTAVWKPAAKESFGDWKHNRHAMAVIGFDDKIAGGAFRVLNSWGTKWGDNGMVWIKYDDYTRWCLMAVQPYANPHTKAPDVKETPNPKPLPSPALVNLGGNIEFKLNTGSNMAVNRISSRNLVVEEKAAAKEELVAYTMMNSYTSGTKFRFFMNIDQEAYIYAFATDLSGKINKILPFDHLTSTRVGANTVVAFPSDTKVIKMDENKGIDYLLILYSKEKMNIDEIVNKMNASNGGLSSKIISALGNKLIAKDKIRYTDKQVGFQVSIDPLKDKGSIVPLMIEIKHD
ncbi:C1 family peptidase [Chitinophaga sp. MM2321]|uniref:C1 family peptidase n=1 Tax=Chitinophaga sp. MM2321 TaxID=3137178 RepID=UPI0032D56754